MTTGKQLTTGNRKKWVVVTETGEVLRRWGVCVGDLCRDHRGDRPYCENPMEEPKFLKEE